MNWLKRKHQMLKKAAQNPALSGIPLRVAVLLGVVYLNSKTEEAWPSVETLAGDLDTDRRNIQRAIAKLVEAGLICCERGKGRLSNIYRLANAFDRMRQQKGASASLAKEPSRTGKRRMAPTKPWPEGWVVGNAELKVANRIAGWDLPKAEEQMEAFRRWAAAGNKRSADWAVAWETWCVRGRDWESGQSQKAKRSGLDPIIEGVTQAMNAHRRRNAQ
jgi:hypothetical protein